MLGVDIWEKVLGCVAEVIRSSLGLYSIAGVYQDCLYRYRRLEYNIGLRVEGNKVIVENIE